MIEIGLLVAATLAFFWYRNRGKHAALIDIDRAGIMMNAVRDVLAAMDQTQLAEALERFSEVIDGLRTQFPGDVSKLAVLHRYTYNSSDEKLKDVVALGNSAHAVALQRTPALVVLTAMGAVALAELNLRKYKLGTRYHRLAETVSVSVKDHVLIASSLTVGDAVNEMGLRRFSKYL